MSPQAQPDGWTTIGRAQYPPPLGGPTMVIRDIGHGWSVWADWLGKEREVFRPLTLDPWQQLRECQQYVQESE